MVRKALALNPNPPSWYHIGLFFDHYRNGRYEDALAEAQKTEGSGDYRLPLFRAAAYAQLGRFSEARRSASEACTPYGLQSMGHPVKRRPDMHLFQPRRQHDAAAKNDGNADNNYGHHGNLLAH